MAIAAETPPPVFAFAADSLTATVTRIGGKAPAEPDSLFQVFPCDSAADSRDAGPAAWFEVEVTDKRAGTDVRFPVNGPALRRGLRIFCREDGTPSPARVAALLRGMATRLRVRMGGPAAGDGK
jgi:hypothetical protein